MLRMNFYCYSGRHYVYCRYAEDRGLIVMLGVIMLIKVLIC
jgi:hypothetical protein